MKNKNILDLTEVGLENLNLVGGKNASLGEMIRNLSNLGIRIPGGLCDNRPCLLGVFIFQQPKRYHRKNYYQH